jgi:GT2 family glycosyltransferase
MTYPAFKLIVVDNGSTDGSQAAVRDGYPGATLIENGKNLGFGEGNNVGIRYALEHGAGWILLLNNDVVVAPDMLSALMNVAEPDPSIGILAPKIYFHDLPDTIWYAGGKVNYWTGMVSHRGLRQKDRGQFDRAEDTAYITGCAMLIRRTVPERVGLFDPIFFPAYSEDADLSTRTVRAGYRLVYVPQARLWHNVSASSGGATSPLKTRLKVEHNLIFFKRYARWYHWLTIPWCVGSLAFLFVFRQLLRGDFGTVAALGRGFLKAISRLFSSGPTPSH